MAKATVGTQATNSSKQLAAKASEAPVRKLVVSPGSIKSIGVGVFHASTKAPQFTLTFKPDFGDQVTSSLDRLDIPNAGKYMLLYQFQNFANKSCEVTIVQSA